MQELAVRSLPPHKTVRKLDHISSSLSACTAEMIEDECKDNSVMLSSSDIKKGKRAKTRGKRAMSRISTVSI